MNYSKAKNNLASLFREYWNDFLTLQGFADYYSISHHQAFRLVNAGRKAHNLIAKEARHDRH